MAKEYICTSGCLWYGRIFLTTSNYSPPDPHPPRTPKKALPYPTFLSQQLLLAKNINFCQSFFSMISCEKTKKTLQRARNNALLLFLHHPKTSFFFVILLLNIPAKIRPPDHWGEGGSLFWTVKHRVNWFSYVLEVPWIRRCLYTYISVLSSFPLLITTPPTTKYFSKKIYLVV